MSTRRATRLTHWLLACAFVASASCTGQDAHLARLAATVINEEVDITTYVFGRATDTQLRPLSGVRVELLGDRVYETTTDDNGYYRFEDVFVAHAHALIGAGGTSGPEGLAQGAVTINANYIILFTHDEMATFRATAPLGATAHRTGNSYVYESAPFAFDAVLVPYAKFAVKVVTGQYDANGEPIAATGAVVEIRPWGTDATLYETYAAVKTTDVLGTAKFDAGHQLAAVSGYMLLVHPYDINPDDADGYEFDLYYNPVDLGPYSAFNIFVSPNTPVPPTPPAPPPAPPGGVVPPGNANYNLHEIIVDLGTAAADAGGVDNVAPTVAFSHPPAGGQIKQNAPIRMYFNRPVLARTIKYRLVGCVGACDTPAPTTPPTPAPPANADPADGLLLTQELERSSLHFAFAAVDQLTNIYPRFAVHVEATSYDGQAIALTIAFTLADNLAPDGVTIPTPQLRLIAGDAPPPTSPEYVSATDMGSVYVFGNNQLDDEAFVGAIYAVVPGAMDPAYANSAGATPTLPLYFSAVQGAAGYRIFGRDQMAMATWVELRELGPQSLPWGDTGIVMTTVALPAGNFDYYNNDGVQTPFCCGNSVQIAVLPFFSYDDADADNVDNNTGIAPGEGTPDQAPTIDPNTMPPLDPNAILVLRDNYGIGVVPQAIGGAPWGTNFQGAASAFSGLLYNQVGTAALSEYPDRTATPAILTANASSGAVTGHGVYKKQGRYDLTWAQWSTAGGATHTAMGFQMAPTTVAFDKLYIGDVLLLADGTSYCVVDGLDTCGAENLVFCRDVVEAPLLVIPDPAATKSHILTGTEFALLGPVRGAGRTDYVLDGSLTASSTFYVRGEIDTELLGLTPEARWVITNGATRVVVDPLAGGIEQQIDPSNIPAPVTSTAPANAAGTNFFMLSAELEEPFDLAAGNVVLGNHPETSLDRASQPGDGQLFLTSVAGIEATSLPRLVTLRDVDPLRREVVRVTGVDTTNQTITVAGMTHAHDAGTVVTLYPYAMLAADFYSGDPTVTLDDPNGAIAGFLGHSLFRDFTIDAAPQLVQIGEGADAEIARVHTQAAGSVVVTLDRDLEAAGAQPLALDHPTGTPVFLKPLVGTEIPTIIAVAQRLNPAPPTVPTNNYSDVDGMKPDVDITITVGRDATDTDTFATKTYHICGILGEALLLESTDQLHRVVAANDTVAPFDEMDVRPADIIGVSATDAAGNTMRPNARFLVGDGTVE